MKSYKEINEEIKPEETLVNHTVEAMSNQRRHRIPKATYAMLALGCAIVFMINNQSKTPEPAPLNTIEERKLSANFDEYIQADSPSSKAMKMFEIAGRTDEVQGESAQKFANRIPDPTKFSLPQGYVTTHSIYRYSSSTQEPTYLLAHYDIPDPTKESGGIFIEVTEEGMPKCLQDPFSFETTNQKIYKEYQLLIYFYSQIDQYNVYAKKDGLFYEIHVNGMNKEAFYVFLDSFLQ